MAMAMAGSDNTSLKDIVKSVSLRYFHTHLRRDLVFQHFEKLKICCCDHYGNEKCSCKESNESLRMAMDHEDTDTVNDFSVGQICVGEIDAVDDIDAVDEQDPRMIHQTHKLFNSSLYNASTQDKEYVIMKNPYVLIISNIRFERRAALRNGGTADLENVKDFCAHVGIPEQSVHVEKDCTKEEIEKVLNKVSTSMSLCDYDSFICFIMSHGNKDGVLGTDNNAIPVDDILENFKGNKCPYLITKPKLFFIQACRGKNRDTGCSRPRGPSDLKTDDDKKNDDRPIKVPSDADIMVAYSTTKGQISMRTYSTSVDVKTIGSWFIYHLVKTFHSFSHQEDLMTMMVRVNHAIAEMHTGKGLKQIACQLSMLRHKLYFGNFRKQT